MMLTVTARGPLEKRYGPEGYTQIRVALTSFAEAAGATLVALDDSADMSAFGLPAAAGTDAGSLLLSIRALKGPHGDVDSLMLVGGDNIIPFFRLTNPVTDRSVDPDEVVFSDNPYASSTETLEEYLAPSLPLGRLTDFARGSTQDFVDLITAATANRTNRTIRQRAALLVNAEWSDPSQSVAAALPGPVDWHFSPGYSIDRTTQADMNREFLHFNLHGFTGVAEWKGYDSVRDQFVIAATTDGFDRQYVSGSVVFAENCYGAEITGRTPANSCALKLVREGAAFIGATGLAFGSHVAPRFLLEDADVLAKSFWGAFAGGAMPLGPALGKARSDYLLRDGAGNNPYKMKTLLQFVLLGDPGWN
jgi:hypothetical protein